MNQRLNSKVKEIAETMEADYNNKLEQESAKAKEELTEKVDSYLSYVVEEWMKENEIALERALKARLLKTLSQVLKNFSLNITLMFQMRSMTF